MMPAERGAAHDLLDRLALALIERDAARQDVDAGRRTIDQICTALDEALEGWAYAAQYKGEYFCAKHGDNADIARLRAQLADVWPTVKGDQ